MDNKIGIMKEVFERQMVMGVHQNEIAIKRIHRWKKKWSRPIAPSQVFSWDTWANAQCAYALRQHRESVPMKMWVISEDIGPGTRRSRSKNWSSSRNRTNESLIWKEGRRPSPTSAPLHFAKFLSEILGGVRGDQDHIYIWYWRC